MEDKLLIRFLERKCEVEEARLVLQWIEQSEENKAAFVRLQSLWTAIEMDKATELNEACVDPSCIRLEPHVSAGIGIGRSQRSHRVQQPFCCLFLFIPILIALPNTITKLY